MTKKQALEKIKEIRKKYFGITLTPFEIAVLLSKEIKRGAKP